MWGRPAMSVDLHSADSRKALRNLVFALGVLREQSATMPIGQVQTFFYVALNEGKSLGELAQLTGFKQSTLSRYLLDLSDKTRKGDNGYDLVRREADPHELRRNMYTLTAKGRKLVEGILAVSTPRTMNGNV